MRVFIIFAILGLLFGCLGTPTEKTECQKGNGCLEDAFIECKNYSGVWAGQNGNITVAILGQNNETCNVSVSILGNVLNISGKSVICEVPMHKNASFTIADNCQGDLVQYFSIKN